MLPTEQRLKDLREWIEKAEDNVLSLYVGVNPAKPVNAGKARLLRAKNALKGLPEIKNRQKKRTNPFTTGPWSSCRGIDQKPEPCSCSPTETETTGSAQSASIYE